MVKYSEKLISFEGWFSIVMPEAWEYGEDGDVINIYSTSDNAKGVIQISLFDRTNFEKTSKEIVDINLKNFINRNQIDIDINTYKIIEGPNMVFANVCGIMKDNFIKVWTLANNKKMLLVTYISKKKIKRTFYSRKYYLQY